MAFLFWVLLIIVGVLFILNTRTNRDPFAIGGNALIFVLVLLLGLKVFQFPGA
jgi:hypothetical protein